MRLGLVHIRVACQLFSLTLKAEVLWTERSTVVVISPPVSLMESRSVARLRVEMWGQQSAT